ncbi:MAG TPA: MarR family transcriptional regulator, partial [Puia sp.]|nr:MarR family transcriptional regulator [Puia sp.]
MALENETNQRKFRNEYQKARLNILYTNNWLSEKISIIFDKWDITPRQFNILRILRGEGKPLSTLQIRQRMLDKMSDTSRIVDRLVRKGLVRKTPNAADRRMMATLSPEEASTLSRLLDKLRNVLPLLAHLALPFFLLLTLALPALSIAQRPDSGTSPRPKYEFRAVWVASVENIDWPSKKGLPVDSQKIEFTRLLDMHQRNGLNAVVVQIRPAADAF